jgi:radical SAM enzyme (rSAM/lipoprotein system)
MPLQDFLKALETIKEKSKFFTVVLTGGEPLLRKDIEKCGQEIRKLGFRWSMVTNGYLYDKEKHFSLQNAGLGALTISIDGMKDSHNWLRNTPNSFKKVDEAIGLAATSKRLNFDVVTCVNQKNINELPEIYDYLIKKGVKAWRLFTTTPIGRAKNNPDLNLSGQQLKYVMDFITEKRKLKKLDIKFSCEGYVGDYELKVRDMFFFCRAGINIGSVLIDGSISACPNIDRSFAQGNIYKDNLFDVWQNKFSIFRNREWTKTGICKNCRDYKDCMGNGLHYWHGQTKELIMCHKEKISEPF